MADPVLHIKDSYYFEVPKMLYPYEHRSRRQFPDVWISLDPEYQKWEADRLYNELNLVHAELPPKEEVLEDWQHFVHADHANFAKPLKVFLNEKYEGHEAAFQKWKKAEITAAKARKDGSDEAKKKLEFSDYIQHLEATGSPDEEYFEFLTWRHRHEESFQRAAREARDIQAWKQDPSIPEWNAKTISKYNEHLSGKILIPQPFATLRNLYQKDEGFAISKYMLIEVAIGLILVLIFSNLASRVSAGGAPRGYLWNLLESFLVFLRDQVVRPAVGGHHEEEHGEGHMPEHGHGHGDPYAEHGGRGHDDARAHHGHAGQHVAAAHGHADDVTRMLPLFWTIFFFVLGCNLFGMLPWMGAPSSSFSVTTALAFVTMLTGIYCGIQKFGFVGHLANQAPSMDLPWYMAIFVKPMVYAIEILGLVIKHGVLAFRLLANMVAGHLVILAIMGISFGATAAIAFAQAPLWQWGLAASISVIASATLSILELFVAFLQAYIFTFLSALFIGATMHKH
jgi:F-type H+-transporting ATPase subunit a